MASVSGKTINRVLFQESSLTGEIRRFEIYNDKFIKVHINNVFGETTYHLNLGMLEPWPVMYRRIAWRWVLGLAYFGLATLIFSGYLYLHPTAETLGRLIPFIALFIILTLGALLMFLYQSPSVLEFRSRYGGCPLLGILKDRPDQKEFRHFTDELKTRALAASQVIRLDKKQMRDIELKELRRLAEIGVLDESDFERARMRMQQLQI